MATDFQSLCEIAERELNCGLADAPLVERSMAEAHQVEAHARQIFWHHRAKQLLQLQASDGEAPIRDLLAKIEAQEARLRSRKNSHRWFWASACVAGMLGATIFPSFAFRSVGKAGSSFFIFLVLSTASLALAGFAYIASRYHTDTE
jgi:hypothetical protein